MRNLSLIAVLLAVLLNCPSSKAEGFQNGFGSGIQYGGNFGWQGSYVANSNRFRLSLGYVGYTLGYDRYLLPNISLGAQVFFNQYKVGSALSANYYFGSGRSGGWMLGFDLYRGVDTIESALDVLGDVFDFNDGFRDVKVDEEPETGVFISIGYHF